MRFLANPVLVTPYLGFILYTAFHSASDIVSNCSSNRTEFVPLPSPYVGFYWGAVQVRAVFNTAVLLCHHPSFKKTQAIILSQLCVKNKTFFY